MAADEDLGGRLSRRATHLLLQIAAEARPELTRAYDELLFSIIYRTVKERGRLMALDAARRIGAAPSLPPVPAADLDLVAINVAVAALANARRTAARFDPSRGDGASWALGAAALAYVDVVREQYQTRRVGVSEATDPSDLAALADRQSTAASPEAVVEARQALEHALSQLSEDERFVVLAQAHYGMSYAEIALYRFRDAKATKRVDRLLQTARLKLDQAERDWNAAP